MMQMGNWRMWCILAIVTSLILAGYIMFVKMDDRNENLSLNVDPKFANLSELILLNATKFFYNRFHKCQSQTTVSLFNKLSVQNNWKAPGAFTNAFSDRRYGINRRYWSDDANVLQKVVDFVMQYRTPSIVYTHVHYIDFARYTAHEAPIYINLIREPLDRLVSWYYFQRNNKMRYNSLPKKTRDLTYDECVQKKIPECVAPTPEGYFTLIPWFCGHDPICLYPNAICFQRARRNIERHYAVVGLKEYYMEFLHSLELMSSKFFKEARQTYNNLPKNDKYRWYHPKGRGKEPSNTTKAIMYKVLKEEVELYAFVKQHFFKLYNQLNHAAPTRSEQ